MLIKRNKQEFICEAPIINATIGELYRKFVMEMGIENGYYLHGRYPYIFTIFTFLFKYRDTHGLCFSSVYRSWVFRVPGSFYFLFYPWKSKFLCYYYYLSRINILDL